MGKKKGKKEKGRGAEKAAQKVAKKSQKDEDIGDLEAMIAEFQLLDKKKTEVYEEKCSTPSPRINLTATLHPDKDEIIMFGGEYYNGHKTFVYNDMFIYNIKKNEWSQLFVPNPPPPRCAHQAIAVSKDGGQLWIFGGEFASPTQSKFYHYKDLWVLHLQEKRWEKINASGCPSPRSGHRMINYKRQLILFGGFHESSRDFVYFNDCYSFNLLEYKWSKLTVSGNGPSPRSGCQLLPLSNDILLLGGYSKVKVKKDIDKGTAHNDMFLLKPETTPNSKSNSEILKWSWVRVKDSGCKPSPRCAFGMTLIGGNRAVMFGGVYDEDEEEDIDSLFYNSMYCLDLDSFRWFPFELRKPKQSKKKEKAPENIDPADPATIQDAEGEDNIEVNTVEKVADSPDKKAICWIPCARMNPILVAKRNFLYLYGGAFEEDKKQVTLNDLWSINLKSMETWKELFEADDTSGDWYESNSESNSSEDESDKMDEAGGGVSESSPHPSDSEDKTSQSDGEAPTSNKQMEHKPVKSKCAHPDVEEHESYRSYWSRTSEYWLECMCREADEDVPADRINLAAKQMSEAWHKKRTKKHQARKEREADGN